MQDIKEIEKDLTEEDFKQMKDLDKLFGASQKKINPEQSGGIDDEDDEEYIRDPYARNRAALM